MFYDYFDDELKYYKLSPFLNKLCKNLLSNGILLAFIHYEIVWFCFEGAYKLFQCKVNFCFIKSIEGIIDCYKNCILLCLEFSSIAWIILK